VHRNVTALWECWQAALTAQNLPNLIQILQPTESWQNTFNQEGTTKNKERRPSRIKKKGFEHTQG
jgi:hypothetical protein